MLQRIFFVYLRWVDDELNGHEEFIGVTDLSVPGTNTNSIPGQMKYVLLRINLKNSWLMLQYYEMKKQ